jgi:hypothetical protein
MAAAAQEVILESGQRQPADQLLERWVKRRDQARKNRRGYEKEWMESQHFAAGKQWLRYIPHSHRVLEKPRTEGRAMRTVDVLGQYGATIIGKLASDDFRPNLLLLQDDREAELYADQLNHAFGWGWEEEWHGDRKLMQILRILWVLGTGAVRCRVERTGKPVGEMPHRNGQPILDPEEAHAYVADRQMRGQSAGIKTLREARVCWDVLSAWNLLPPPGVEDPHLFPWEIIVRPVPMDELETLYGSKTSGVKPDTLEELALVGLSGGQEPAGSASPSVASGLTDHVLVYTGYCKPTAKYPHGEKIVFAGDDPVLLDYERTLPYQDEPWGPRSGITYYRYGIVTGRFFGRAGIEPGKDPQKLRNKRVSQIDEHIDRGQAKVYLEEPLQSKPEGLVMEEVILGRGNQRPVIDPGIPVGPWMVDDVRLQDENIEKAVGLHQVSMGSAPPGVFPYSYIALLAEQDAQKLGPIADDLRLNTADLSRDTLEAMRQWGPQKEMLVADPDDPESRLRATVFNAARIPVGYKVTPAKKGALPRSQGAELQKINDLWTAAVTIKVADRKWLQWYDESLDAGKAQDLPLDPTSEQQHKAALENIVMERAGQPVPVADYDDPQVHVPEHRQAESMLEQSVMEGDQTAMGPLQAVRQHVLMHEQQASQNALTVGQGPQPGMPPGGPQGPPGAPQGGPPPPGGPPPGPGGPQIPPGLIQALAAH